mgnify:CR=1 FL=1
MSGFRPSLILLMALGLSGCAAAAIGLSTLGSAVGIYQRYEDRQTQNDQNEEIRKLREEIAATRQQLHDDLLRLIPPP